MCARERVCVCVRGKNNLFLNRIMEISRSTSLRRKRKEHLFYEQMHMKFHCVKNI
jgi:hypothetical protein